AQQRLDAAIRMDDVILKTFAAKMQVRKEAEQGCVVRQSAEDFHAKIVRLRRNYEAVIGQLQSQHALHRRLFGEYDSDCGLIGSGSAVGGVVHLENEI